MVLLSPPTAVQTCLVLCGFRILRCRVLHAFRCPSVDEIANVMENPVATEAVLPLTSGVFLCCPPSGIRSGWRSLTIMAILGQQAQPLVLLSPETRPQTVVPRQPFAEPTMDNSIRGASSSATMATERQSCGGERPQQSVVLLSPLQTKERMRVLACRTTANEESCQIRQRTLDGHWFSGLPIVRQLPHREQQPLSALVLSEMSFWAQRMATGS